MLTVIGYGKWGLHQVVPATHQTAQTAGLTAEQIHLGPMTNHTVEAIDLAWEILTSKNPGIRKARRAREHHRAGSGYAKPTEERPRPNVPADQALTLINHLRTRQGLTLTTIAELTGLSKHTLADISSGRTKHTRAETIDALELLVQSY